MPHPSSEPIGLPAPPDRPVPSVPEVRTEGFDGVRDIEALGRVASVIGHELTNARDATPPGSIVVAELSRVERAAGPACRIAVTDRGEGMTPEVMRQAVEPFFTTRSPGHGLGLGLTIARMVAESHGGYLEVDSRVGTGTTVSISLPIAESDALSQRGRTSRPQPASPAPASAPPLAAGSAASTPAVPSPSPAPKPARIMVVDDEEAIAEYFRIILSAEQYDVTVVPSLQRAIETFTRDHLKFDTVLLDMMLGDGTGLDLYRRVREMRPDIPVVVCTGFAENDSLELIREDGHEVLLKPCTRHEVLRAVNRALLRRRLA